MTIGNLVYYSGGMTNFRYTVTAHKRSDGSEFIYAQARSRNVAIKKCSEAERCGFGPARIVDAKGCRGILANGDTCGAPVTNPDGTTLCNMCRWR